MNNVRVCIIDSGVDITHPSINSININGYSIEYSDKANRIVIKDGIFDDSIGHGTAVTAIIQNIFPSAAITMVKLLDDDLSVSPDLLYKALEHLSENNQYDLINLSLGIVELTDISHLEMLCKRIVAQGTLIISAFDNTGAVSFPASFDCVIGVDSSIDCRKINHWEYVENSIVNIRGIGSVQRVPWKNPQYVITNGNSFTCACITGYAALFISECACHSCDDLLEIFKKKAVAVYTAKRPNKKHLNHLDPNLLGRAALFPINKETQSLLRYTDLLPFQIKDVYDIKYSGNVGKRVNEIISCELPNDMIVRDFAELQFSEIDSLIVGHIVDIERILKSSDLIYGKINMALKENKRVFLFDKPNEKSLMKNHNVYFPENQFRHIIDKTMMKLFYIPQPILGIVGTSSKQGKFTLHLEIRKRFLRDGYKLGSLGTEPHSVLFGFDETFHCGFNSKLKMSITDTVQTVNQLMWNISRKSPDIITVGFQAGLTPKNIFDLSGYPLVHHLVLHGTRPDAFLLCFNYDDEIDTIEDCIKTAEGITGGVVIGLVCFPKILRKRWEKDENHFATVPSQNIELLKQKLSGVFGIPVYVLGQKKDMDDAYKHCISFFAEKEK